MDPQTAIGLFMLALAVGIYGSIIGAGGGFLVVAGLVILFDLEGATAAGTSIVTTLFIQMTGALTYDRQGLVDRPTARWFITGSVPVAFVSAAWLASRIPTDLFELAISILLIVLAAFVILVPSPSAPEGTTYAPRKPQLVAAGSAVGVLSGAVGVGAGLVTVPLLGRLQRLSAHRAAATTTAVGSMAGLSAVTGHTLAGNPRWSFIPFLIGGAVLGGRLGSLNADRLAPRTVTGLIAIGLLGAGIPLLIRSL